MSKIEDKPKDNEEVENTAPIEDISNYIEEKAQEKIIRKNRRAYEKTKNNYDQPPRDLAQDSDFDDILDDNFRNSHIKFFIFGLIFAFFGYFLYKKYKEKKEEIKNNE